MRKLLLLQGLPGCGKSTFVREQGLEAETADASFAASVLEDVYQVHGHRNRYASPLQVSDRCFNLEGKVEFGGELRTITLSPDGFEARCIKSAIDASDEIIDPAGDLAGWLLDVSSLVNMLRHNNSIYEKPQPGTNVSSFNFKRDVFSQKSWDSLNVHARGLFINVDRNSIVARSYEKFFNIGERPETQPDMLVHSLKFPVKAWVKENGYLGLVGYDPESDDLVFASKSSLSSEFAGWLKSQFDTAVGNEHVRNELKLYLQSEGGRTLVFEVIEPANDPHIIAYNQPELILLDIVRNTVVLETEDAKSRVRIAALIGCRVKQSAAILNDSQAFLGWYNATKEFGYSFGAAPIEGFVIEDSTGYMVKVKLPWYAFWRQMRTQLIRLQTGKKAGLPSLDINNLLAQKFLNYLATKDQAELQAASLVQLRDDFTKSLIS